MNDVEKLLKNEAGFFLFDQLTAEIHIWKILWDDNDKVKTWELIFANAPALRTWERESLDEVKGKTTDEIFGVGATEHYLEIVQKIVDENKPYTYRDHFEHLKKHFRFTSVPFGDYFITTGDDITEFVEQHLSVIDERNELESLVKMRTAKLKTTEEEIRTLRGVIPICSYCHNIRDEKGAWDQLEAYISAHSVAQFSHGICPECRTTALEEIGLDENG